MSPAPRRGAARPPPLRSCATNHSASSSCVTASQKAIPSSANRAVASAEAVLRLSRVRREPRPDACRVRREERRALAGAKALDDVEQCLDTCRCRRDRGPTSSASTSASFTSGTSRRARHASPARAPASPAPSADSLRGAGPSPRGARTPSTSAPRRIRDPRRTAPAVSRLVDASAVAVDPDDVESLPILIAARKALDLGSALERLVPAADEHQRADTAAHEPHLPAPIADATRVLEGSVDRLERVVVAVARLVDHAQVVERARAALGRSSATARATEPFEQDPRLLEPVPPREQDALARQRLDEDLRQVERLRERERDLELWGGLLVPAGGMRKRPSCPATAATSASGSSTPASAAPLRALPPRPPADRRGSRSRRGWAEMSAAGCVRPATSYAATARSNRALASSRRPRRQAMRPARSWRPAHATASSARSAACSK